MYIKNSLVEVATRLDSPTMILAAAFTMVVETSTVNVDEREAPPCTRSTADELSPVSALKEDSASAVMLALEVRVPSPLPEYSPLNNCGKPSKETVFFTILNIKPS
jgi:hypothetical protein